jgi:hypothetical protein
MKKNTPLNQLSRKLGPPKKEKKKDGLKSLGLIALGFGASQLMNNRKNKKEEEKEKNSPLQLKDACYNKVKAKYRVFPSAYASGAIAKCRKVGAANWGNKSKK